MHGRCPIRTELGALRVALLAVLMTVAGCSAPRVNNTRLGSSDLVVMTDRMVASLLNDAEVAPRTAGSNRWVVTLDRVANRTNDVLPERERWAFMARLRAQLSQSAAMRERNIAFIVPAERRANVEHEGHTREALKPTHALAATFYGLTTATRSGRTDTYVCAFQLLDLSDDRVRWEDSYEVKRAVVRNRLD